MGKRLRRLRTLSIAVVLCLALGVLPGASAQEQVPPELVYAERYLEKGWYREAWELVDPLVREAKEPSGRLLVAAVESTYGLDQVGQSMGFSEVIHRKEEKGDIALTDEQRKRLTKIEREVVERFGVLAFEWPPAEDRPEGLGATEKLVLEWSDARTLSDRDQAAFDLVFQKMGRDGVTDGDRVYLPKGKISVNGIWKDIGDEVAVFRVSQEKPPALQRVDTGDGLALGIGFVGVPGYQGNSYDGQFWEPENFDDELDVGIGSRRFGLTGMPRFEISATHSLITQGWKEIGIKGFFGWSPASGIQGAVPEGENAAYLPEPAMYFNFGILGRQSFHASRGVLVALAAGAQGIYTPTMRYVARGVESEEAQTTCSDSTSADLMIVDRKTMGAGFLTSFEVSKSIEALKARVGLETVAGYNLAIPVPAQAVSAITAPEDFGTSPCFEDEDVLLSGWDLRAQLFFRVALW